MALIKKLEEIGNAIRRKTGKTALLTLPEMVTEIDNIETGGTGTIVIDDPGTYDVSKLGTAEVTGLHGNVNAYVPSISWVWRNVQGDLLFNYTDKMRSKQGAHYEVEIKILLDTDKTERQLFGYDANLGYWGFRESGVPEVGNYLADGAPSVRDGQWHIIKWNNGPTQEEQNIEIDGTKYARNGGYIAITSNTAPFGVFDIYGFRNWPVYGKVAYIKVWEDKKLIAHLIPCVTAYQGYFLVGFWNKLTDELHGSADTNRGITIQETF